MSARRHGSAVYVVVVLKAPWTTNSTNFVNRNVTPVLETAPEKLVPNTLAAWFWNVGRVENKRQSPITVLRIKALGFSRVHDIWTLHHHIV
jgi:hypothetical protein